MASFFQARDRWGNGRALYVLLLLMFLVPTIGYGLKQAHFNNDVRDWLPEGDQDARILAWHDEHFQRQDTFLVSWDDSSLDDPRVGRFIDRLQGTPGPDGKLVGGVSGVQRVTGPNELLTRMTDAGIPREEAIRRLRGVLIGAEADAPVALYVSLASVSSREYRTLMPAIQDAAEEVGIDPDAFHMAGTPVGQWQLDVESTRSIWNRSAPVWQLHERSPFLLSGLVGMIVAFLLLRSLRLATLVLVVSVYSAAITIVLIPLVGPRLGGSGSLNIVLSVMPNLLLVLTASGAIHMANYWRHAAAHDPRTAIVEAFRIGRRPCVMASLTTAIGMAALGTSGLVPVRDFGLYSAAGTLLSLLMILYGFPSILAVFGGLPRRFKELETGHWQRFGGWVARHHVACSALFLALLAAGVWGLRSFHTETRVIRYFPDEARIVRDYNAVEESLAGVVTIDVVVYFDQAARERMNVLERMELVRAVQKSMDGAPGVSGTLSLADFRPVSAPPGPNATTFQRITYGRRAQRTERELFGDQSESAGQLVTHVQTPLEFVRGGEVGPAAWLRSRLLGSGTAELSGGRLVRFESGTGARSIGFNTGAPDEPRTGNEIWRIRAQTEMMSTLNYTDVMRSLDERIGAVLRDEPGVEHVATGMVPLFLRTQQAVIESLMTSFALAFLVIAATMILLLRSVACGLLSMIPNVWPIVVVFGGVSLAGVPIDIGTMITGSVAMGIAIDGTVHLLTWFQQAIREGRPRDEAVAWAMGHCGPALWQTSGAIALAMLMLMFADLLLVSRFGWIMSAAVFAAMIADLVLTPALLAGPLGRMIERSVQGRATSRGEDRVHKLAGPHAPVSGKRHRVKTKGRSFLN